MLKVIAENQTSEKDIRVFEAVKQGVEFSEHETLEQEFEDLKKCKFGGYTEIGIGGNHIWVARKCDGKRIVLIINNDLLPVKNNEFYPASVVLEAKN